MPRKPPKAWTDLADSIRRIEERLKNDRECIDPDSDYYVGMLDCLTEITADWRQDKNMTAKTAKRLLKKLNTVFFHYCLNLNNEYYGNKRR